MLQSTRKSRLINGRGLKKLCGGKSMNKTTQKKALPILAAGCLWGCIGVFLKLLGSVGLGSMQAVAVRMVIAALLYVGSLAITDPAALKIRLRDIWCFVGTGVCSLLFFNFCYFNAITYSSMGTAAVLLYTSPIFVMLMSAVLFGERLTRQKLGALALAFLGCALVSGAGGSLSSKALIFGLGAGFGYALYTIFGIYALRRYSAKTVTAYSFAVGAVAVLPLTRWKGVGSALLTLPGFVGAVGISVICCVLPYLLYTLGLSKVSAGTASTLATVEPVVAAVLGIVFYNEPITPQKLFGIGLVLAAVWLLGRKFGPA